MTMKINNILRYSIVTGLFALLFIPFIIADSQFFPFITGKGFTFRIIVEVIFVLWVALMLRDRNFAPKPSYILWSVFAFLGIIGLADMFGAAPYKSFWSNYERMEGYITLLHLGAYFLVTSSVFVSEKMWSYFLNTSIGASIIMSIYCFLQLAGKITINQGGVRVDGTFGNATYLAVYMLLHFFFCLWFFVRTRNVGARIFYGVAMLLQFIILYKTSTRGTMLGLIGGLLLTSLILALFERNRPTVRKVSIGAIVAILIVIGGFWAIKDSNFVLSSPVLSRFSTISLSESAIKAQGRYFVWPMAIQGFQERPILGWGQENFNYVFNEHYNPQMYNHEQWFDRTHNVILDWLIAGGLLGLLSYLGLFVALLYYVFRSSLPTTEKAVITGLIVGYTFHNLFVFDNLISYIFFFSLLAYVQGVHATKNKQTFGFINNLGNQKTLAQAVSVVVLIGMIFVVYSANIKPIIANRALIDSFVTTSGNLHEDLDDYERVFDKNTFGSAEASEQLLLNVDKFYGDQVPQDVRQRFANLAIKEIGNQHNRVPNDARYAMFFGSLYSRLGDYASAVPFLEKAVELSPRKQSMYFELGSTYLAAGDTEKALQAFKTAYDFAPEYQEAQFGYASAAIIANNITLANEILAKIPEEKVAFDPRIFNAYVVAKRMPQAISILNTRIKLEPNNPQHHLLLAAVYLNDGQRAKAIQEIREVIRMNPDFKEQGEFYIREINAGRNP